MSGFVVSPLGLSSCSEQGSDHVFFFLTSPLTALYGSLSIDLFVWPTYQYLAIFLISGVYGIVVSV